MCQWLDSLLKAKYLLEQKHLKGKQILKHQTSLHECLIFSKAYYSLDWKGPTSSDSLHAVSPCISLCPLTSSDSWNAPPDHFFREGLFSCLVFFRSPGWGWQNKACDLLEMGFLKLTACPSVFQVCAWIFLSEKPLCYFVCSSHSPPIQLHQCIYTEKSYNPIYNHFTFLTRSHIVFIKLLLLSILRLVQSSSSSVIKTLLKHMHSLM